MSPDAFHVGERRAQALAGFGDSVSDAAIRSFMPDQHRLFFNQLPFVTIATLEADGVPTATLLTGPPGFMASPDPRTLRIVAVAHDPAGQRLVPGAPVGMLGIAPAARRRNRANGVVIARDPFSVTIGVRQSFGNCPQYIHPRGLAVGPRRTREVETFTGLDEAACAQVATADTFLVATSSGAVAESGGVDVSHRGGPAGFVRVEGDTLVIPDYRGNRYMNTLGNLLVEPRAALLFVDFVSGRLLHLSGRAEVRWDERDLPHAERTWRFTVERGWRGDAGLRRQLAVQPPSTLSAAPVAEAPTSETR